MPNTNAKSLKLAVIMTGELCVVDKTGDFEAQFLPWILLGEFTAIPQTPAYSNPPDRCPLPKNPIPPLDLASESPSSC